MVLAIKENWSL